MLRISRVSSRLSDVQRRCFHSTYQHRQEEQLKILFCGSDLFSVKHLEALHEYQQSEKSRIASIDVVTRTDKRTGRGLKVIRTPPIKDAALSYGLPVHQIDTFTGWTPPEANLVIAVSFGLLIPSRIIRSSKYGGLNVHPSLLPDLRGAAPVEWAIAHGRKHTGVSVQTLHETRFDHGTVLLQSDKIELPEHPSPGHLKAELEVIGAKMLIDALRYQLYLPFHKSTVQDTSHVVNAPKIKDEHKLLDFRHMRSQDIDRRQRAFGDLYAFIRADGRRRRLKLAVHEHHQQTTKALFGDDLDIPVGVPYARVFPNENILQSKARHLEVKCIDGGRVIIAEMTVEGYPKLPAAQAAARAHLFDDPIDAGNGLIYKLKAPLTTT